MNSEQTPHLEARIWQVSTYAGGLFLDRFLTRLLPFTIPGLLVSMLRPEYGNHTILVACFLATIWAIADLARGIELDHKYKETTLRDKFLAWYHSPSSK